MNFKLLSTPVWIFLTYFAMIIPEWSYKKHLVLMFGLVLAYWWVVKKWEWAWWLGWLTLMLFNLSYVWVTPKVLPEEYTGWWKSVDYVYTLWLSDFLFLPMLVKSLLLNPKKWLKNISKIIILILLSAMFSNLNQEGWYPWFALIVLVKYWLIWGVARTLFERVEIKRWTLEIIVVFATLNGVLMMMQMINGGPLGLAIEDKYAPFGRFADENPDLYRPGGLSWNANLTASVMLMAIPMIVYLRKYWLLIPIIVGIVMSGSRYVWVTLVFQVLLLWRWGELKILKMSWEVLEKKFKVFLGVLGGIIIIFVGWRMLSLSNTLGFEYRLSHWRLTSKSLVLFPMGVGVDNFKYWVVDNFPPWNYFYDSSPQHNWFLEAFTSFGIVGGTLIVVWVTKIVISIVKKRNLIGLVVISYLLVNQMYSSWFSVTMTQIAVIVLAMYQNDSKKRI